MSYTAYIIQSYVCDKLVPIWPSHLVAQTEDVVANTQRDHPSIGGMCDKLGRHWLSDLVEDILDVNVHTDYWTV